MEYVAIRGYYSCLHPLLNKRVSFQHKRFQPLYTSPSTKRRTDYEDVAGATVAVAGGGAAVPSPDGGAVSPFSPGFGEIGIFAVGGGAACRIDFLPLAL
jgi:hypothetical protein